MPDEALPTYPSIEKVPSKRKFVDEFVDIIVSNLPDSVAVDVKSHQVNDKYLNLSIGNQGTFKIIKGEKRSKRHKKMSSKQCKNNHLQDLPKESESFDLYLPLHELWTQYIIDVTRDLSSQEITRKLAKSDWHGSLIQVVQSYSTHLIGLTGIVLQETTFTFKIISVHDKYFGIKKNLKLLKLTFLVIPKKNNIFSFKLDNILVTLYGNNICYKSSERSSRKFKQKTTIDIN